MRVHTALCSGGLAVSLFVASAQAELIDTFEIGEGSAMAQIQFDFMVGHTYLYEIRWDGSEMTGRDVFDLIASAQPNSFDFTYISYSFGDFLTSVTIGDDFDAGDGSEAPDYVNYWHYWNRIDGGSWESSMTGFSDRLLEDGSWDGWVFGAADAPQEIPSPGALAIAGIALLTTRARRRHI